ncbi:type I-F CRISPR-associated helicase Cas3f [Sansalvadorimonas verongulae]|uniref:type I-F CRISPR-associated helicase Cas3f n=1 Tax=Sansalvadorimonas verongulae TaxID=2172824 RepID=UPI001E29859B|nr:type I-F CRISPR-associated helicase Cas3f [Sansalvadorimonas verongulae]
MQVTFVSQCDKKALKKTRRVLDAFADRIGDNTWQTVITQEGLNAVRKLLRKSATKSTAVSCHWIRSRSHTELVWTVGRKQSFDHRGRVPVNRTRRVLTGAEWETGWTMATSIQILSALAALLHDLGKATQGFQKKLQKRGKPQADPYRHEWLSLRLFEALIQGCSSDKEWLERFVNIKEFFNNEPDWASKLHNDSQQRSEGIFHLPSLARMVAWLIVTHHRLPFEDRHDFSKAEKLCKKSRFLGADLDRFFKRLAPYNNWVYSQRSDDERQDTDNFWRFSAQATESGEWQKNIQRWSRKALNHPPFFQLPAENNPLLMHLSRLCLMVGDHNYSSLSADDKSRVTGDPAMVGQLTANTCRKTGEPKQALDEHLIGVARFTGAFSRLLPRFVEELPRLESLAALSRRTPIKRFQWQNQSWNLIKKHHKEARKQGFFGVNLASTGCGKTLGNARIMTALADPDKRPRFTIAMGLRVLTLQTGLALREKLKLDDTELAILVGGSAQRKLFELHQQEIEQESQIAAYGSESEEPLISEGVDYENCALDQKTLGTIIHDPKARDLLYAPIVSCTVDHIIGATETQRGGRHIVPMLRLLTSDLVLDEPDDFDQNDLPALTRLVHMAGMMGSHVLLSSATLTPDLVQGLFIAYQKGRAHWQANLGEKGTGIYCAWFDEFSQVLQPCQNADTFGEVHTKFIRKRVKALDELPARRVGSILPTVLPKTPENENINNGALASIVINGAHRLHQAFHETCPVTGKTASVGLMRMANINPLFALAQAIYRSPQPENTQIHLCCYHARQLLFLRNRLEQKLDRILDRNGGISLFEHQEISGPVRSSEKQHHIFIVLATAVAEVGRDHDYDWAIIEPSSMRSIIQLVGRVWRHRHEKVADKPNILILDNNVKALEGGTHFGMGRAVFTQPGFESAANDNHLLQTHTCSEGLITEQQLARIDAVPRISKPHRLEPTLRLADLEHAVMEDLVNHPSGANAVNAFWKPNGAMQATVHLQKVTPFRKQTTSEIEFVAVPDEDQESGIRFRYGEKAWEDPRGEESINSKIGYTEFVPQKAATLPWMVTDYEAALDKLSERLEDENPMMVAIRFASVRLDDQKDWCFHPWFGFWPRK